jgi:hypothetical protein
MPTELVHEFISWHPFGAHFESPTGDQSPFHSDHLQRRLKEQTISPTNNLAPFQN